MHECVKCICWAQSMDLRNPWITLREVWILALCDDPQIVCSIHGLHNSQCAKYRFASNSFSKVPVTDSEAAMKSKGFTKLHGRKPFVHPRLYLRVLSSGLLAVCA